MTVQRIEQRIEAMESRVGNRERPCLLCIEEIDGTLKLPGEAGREIDPYELDRCSAVVITTTEKVGDHWLTDEELAARYPKRKVWRERKKQQEALR